MKRIFIAVSALVMILLLAMPAHAQSYPSGMVSYWKFDEGSGASAGDSVDGNPGELAGPIGWTDGIVGKAVDVQPLGRVRIPPSSNLSQTSAFTLEAWVYPFSISPTYTPVLITKTAHRSSRYTNYALVISRSVEPQCPTGSNCLQFRMGNVSWLRYCYGSAQIGIQEWTHIAVTYEGATKTLRFFVNGDLDNTCESIPTDPIANSEPVFIGWNSEQALEPEAYNGLIDEVALYDRALSESELRTHYESGLLGLGYGMVVQATVDVDPDALNMKSKGQYVTCYLEFPDPYGPDDVSVESIQMEVGEDGDLVAAIASTAVIGDHDTDRIPDLTVKFDRSSVQSVSPLGDILMTIQGSFADGALFTGSDTIKVFDKGQAHVNQGHPNSVVE